MASLEKQSSQPPQPFPLNAQYVANIAGPKGEDGDSEASGDEGDVKSKRSRVAGKKPNSKKNKTKAKAKSSKEKPPAKTGETTGSNDGWKYGAIRNAFIQDQRNKGVGFDAAKSLWDSSEQEAQLLSVVSVQELKRRKFLPKGASENPWFQKLHGPAH